MKKRKQPKLNPDGLPYHMPPQFECSICHTTKPIDEFYLMPNSKRGHHTSCKQCAKEYNAKNAERNCERSRKWKKENDEWVAKQTQEYRETHKEVIRERFRKYYEDNREQCLAARATYRLNNLEKCRKLARDYYDEHKDEINARVMISYHDRMENEEGYAEHRSKVQREYYHKNRERIRAKARVKYKELSQDPEYMKKRNAYEKKRYAAAKAKALLEQDNDTNS